MPGPRAFCDRDRDWVGSRLAELPLMHLRLHGALGDRGQRSDTIRSPFGPRLPLREDVDALLRLVTEILCCWEERVRDIAHLVPLDTALSRSRQSTRAVAQAARTLTAHLDVLLALDYGWMVRAVPVPITSAAMDRYGQAEVIRTVPGYAIVHANLDGGSAGLEVLYLHYRCRDILGETRPVPEELLGVPCRNDGCGLRALRRADPPWRDTDTEYWSSCTACGDQLTHGEYTEWVKLNAAYHRAVAARPVLVTGLPGRPLLWPGECCV